MIKSRELAIIWACVWGIVAAVLECYATYAFHQAPFSGLRLFAEFIWLIALLGVWPTYRRLPANALRDNRSTWKLNLFLFLGIAILLSIFGRQLYNGYYHDLIQASDNASNTF